jgi:hypothetical protein
MPLTLVERVERAAMAEARAYFAERLRREYRISAAGSDRVLHALGQHVLDTGGSRSLWRRKTEDLLDYVYVAVKRGIGGRNGVEVSVDTDDGAEVTVEHGVRYYRLDVACTMAHAAYVDPRAADTGFRLIADLLRVRERVHLPR